METIRQNLRTAADRRIELTKDIEFQKQKLMHARARMSTATSKADFNKVDSEAMIIQIKLDRIAENEVLLDHWNKRFEELLKEI